MLARNYTLPGIKGEVDIVGCDGLTLAFIEVKTRDATLIFSLPSTPVNPEKRRRLICMARQFLRSR